MKEINFYPKDRNKLAFLSSTITEMFVVMDHYIKVHADFGCFALPYDSTERATLSILAGAIWRSDESNLVLEEFDARKKWEQGDYKGRHDIWFLASGQSCFGEAKQKWLKLSKIPEEVAMLLSVLQTETTSVQDFERSDPPPEPPELGIGILFATPYFLEARISEAKDLLTTYHQVLSQRIPRWCDENKFHVLWAKYVPTNLLHENGCYDWDDEKARFLPKTRFVYLYLIGRNTATAQSNPNCLTRCPTASTTLQT